MTLKRAFAQFMEDNGFGTFGTDLFIGVAPLNIAPVWWIVSTGGAPIVTNQTGERRKQYVISVYFRDTSAQEVDEEMHNFEQTVNSLLCDYDLEDFETLDVTVTTFPTDQDLDSEDQTVGLAQVTIQTYL